MHGQCTYKTKPASTHTQLHRLSVNQPLVGVSFSSKVPRSISDLTSCSTYVQALIFLPSKEQKSPPED